MVDHKLQHGGFRHRERQFDGVAGRVPAGPVAQGTGVAARGVGGRGLGEQFAHRIGRLLGQLDWQRQAGSGVGEGEIVEISFIICNV